jgi:hypothetical protein
VSVDDGVELGSDDIFYNTTINDPTSVDAGDLDFLADGTFDESEGDEDNDVDYEQEITIGANEFNFFQDDDDLPEAAPAVLLDASTTMYTYTLDFDDDVVWGDSIGSDFQGAEIDIQGRTYTISDTKEVSSAMDELTLQVGETSIWLTKGQEPVTKTIAGVDHQVSVQGVNQNEDVCFVKVDGVTVNIDQGDTERVSGVDVGVIDVIAAHTAGGQLESPDSCKLTLGADEIVLKDNEKVEINGDEVEDAEVTMNAGTVADSWDGFSITFEPEDDVYVVEGDAYTDPVFGNFKIYFANLVAGDADEITFDASSRDGEVKMMNKDGNALSFDLRLIGSAVELSDGDDADDRIYLEGESNDFSGTDITEAEGSRFLYNFNNEAHILEVTEIDVDEETFSFRDLTEGRDINDKDIVFGDDGGNVTFTIALGSGYSNIELRPGQGGVNLSNAILLNFSNVQDDNTFLTEEEAVVSVSNAGSDVAFSFTEYDDSETDTDPAQYTVTATKDATDNEIEFDVALDDGDYAAIGVAADDESEADSIDVTEKGGWVRYNVDDDKDNFVDIMHYRDSVYGQVFIAPTGATSSGNTDSDGCTQSCTPNPIPSSANKFDNEVSNPTAQNVIAIGGPCANSVTSQLMGNPETCYEGFEAGKAVIKLVETGDKVALIVAGGTGMDTQLASRIIQNYGQYGLMGKEMVATTVSESSLKVDKVA